MKMNSACTMIGAAFGVFMSLIGYSFLTWQFWVAIGLMTAMQVCAGKE